MQKTPMYVNPGMRKQCKFYYVAKVTPGAYAVIQCITQDYEDAQCLMLSIPDGAIIGDEDSKAYKVGSQVDISDAYNTRLADC